MALMKVWCVEHPAPVRWHQARLSVVLGVIAVGAVAIIAWSLVAATADAYMTETASRAKTVSQGAAGLWGPARVPGSLFVVTTGAREF